MPDSTRPTKADLLAAAGAHVADVIAPRLRVLFCGINPGLYSGYTGHHFARPGNRFWPALYAGGFTPRLFKPAEETELLPLGYGIINLVERATATAAELTDEELIAGGQALLAKLEAFEPQVVAVLGVTAFRVAFGLPRATLGRQPVALGRTCAWVLPNPSGLNAHFTPTSLAQVFGELRGAVEDTDRA